MVNVVAGPHDIVTVFRSAVAHHHGAVAIDGPGLTLTYGELDERSDRVARMLVRQGVCPGDRVGLQFEREPTVMIALLGILKSGAGVVPLLSSLPSERLRHLIDDAEIRCVVASDQTPRSSLLVPATVMLDTCLQYQGVERLPAIDPEGLASILYTSGTTGTPKGVPQSHRLMLRKIQRVHGALGIAAGDRVTAFSTPAMSQGLQPVLMTLVHGATSCPFDIRADGIQRLAAWMTGQRLSVWYSSVSLLRTLARAMPTTQFPDLRLVRMGGERVLPTDIAAARRLFPQAEIFVFYATTETGSVSCHRIERGALTNDGTVPIGRPLAGLSVTILDEQGRAVAAGVEGEITVQGRDISSGYWRAPELTAQRFSVIGGDPSERRYRTGDLGRWRDDGLLEHLGRKDLRVKIRGFRIEIEEIEAVLMQQVDVVRAAVAARPGADGNPRLIAYVQLVAEADVTVESLRVELGRRLADYMIPSVFVFVDHIPLGDSGKIARQRLPEPPPERPALSASYVAPRTPREATIAAVWCEVLGLTAVGVDDEFFSVGGDSLKATLIASRVNARLGLNVPLSTIFESSTVAQLSANIERFEADRR